ncbi:unnamed protein product [Darwinula stevensoni]|uniref:Uncharacterized protein n=1 Tax=Darwinula stevensoni TaxID=69355 RepID=A0A7R8XF10_9CRUS|nr:unnamed protein product [Darwinula stevensoni]CAG0894526.1 unnamed protein product [Darwinula stevensoni]
MGKPLSSSHKPSGLQSYPLESIYNFSRGKKKKKRERTTMYPVGYQCSHWVTDPWKQQQTTTASQQQQQATPVTVSSHFLPFGTPTDFFGEMHLSRTQIPPAIMANVMPITVNHRYMNLHNRSPSPTWNKQGDYDALHSDDSRSSDEKGKDDLLAMSTKDGRNVIYNPPAIPSYRFTSHFSQRGLKRSYDMHHGGWGRSGHGGHRGSGHVKRNRSSPSPPLSPHISPHISHPEHIIYPREELDLLSQEIWDKFMSMRQDDETLFRKHYLRTRIYTIIKHHFPYCRLYLVGSSMTGFGIGNSDVDMCLMISPGDIDQRNEATLVLRRVSHVLRKFTEFVTNLELIRAKVPILKFGDAVSGIEVDLNCNNSVGIRNTHLLYAYANADWRVKPLVLIVKLWAQRQNINDAKNMTISSYSLTLMVIHYLQVVEPGVVPSMQEKFPHTFSPQKALHFVVPGENVEGLLQPSPNRTSLAELFLGFLHYYAYEFNYAEHAISVRLGKAVPISLCRYAGSPKNDPFQWKCLCIEEPFDHTNTARSVYDEKTFEGVLKVFRWSHDQLKKTQNLGSILSERPMPE